MLASLWRRIFCGCSLDDEIIEILINKRFDNYFVKLTASHE